MKKVSLTKKQRWVTGLVMAQLVLVGLGASQRELWSPESKLGAILDYYGTLSGANSRYGFFAPGVGSQLRGRFDVYGTEGDVRTDVIESGRSREADLRVGNILTYFWSESTSRPLQRSLAASWAGKIFARNPGAAKVGVRLESYELPSMAEYREGKRPEWRPYYEAKFIRQARKTEGESGENDKKSRG